MGADEFWARARADVATAKRRVLVQAMSFEGDAAGLAVADVILASAAADRRVLVDDYTRVNINDRSLNSTAARRDAILQAEVAATDAMFRGLVAGGTQVRITNPIGRLGLNYPARNHKKLIVADGAAYVGGINFCDHNFAWPDLMLRIEGAEAAGFLAADFDRTFSGLAGAANADLGALRLMALDGRSNRSGFAEIFDRIVAARQEIVVVSPYATAPFTDLLGRAAHRGVRVRLLTPLANNKPIVRDALLSSADRHGFEIVLGPVMSHLKGLLIDGETLIVGSSNFDFASLAAEEEFLAIVVDLAIIADFRARVIVPAERDAIQGSAGLAPWRGRAAGVVLRLAAIAASTAKDAPRQAIDWGRSP